MNAFVEKCNRSADAMLAQYQQGRYTADQLVTLLFVTYSNPTVTAHALTRIAVHCPKELQPALVQALEARLERLAKASQYLHAA